jgi:hypothetical protein
MSKFVIKYKRNKHQAEFHADTTTKFLHLSSGFGGGKSYALVMKALQLSRLNAGIPGGCVNPSFADYKKDLLPLFEEILDRNRVRYRHHRTEHWYQFPWSSGKMYVTTAEKRIRGPNWGWAIVNEATLISQERYREIMGRVRIKGAPNPQIASSGTPEGIANWNYEMFVESPMTRSRIIYGDTRDNQENLADDYIQTLESNYDAVMLDAYLRGLHVNMNGNRFYYAYDPARNDDEKIEQIPGAEVHVSLDYNVSPMVGTLWNIVPLVNRDGLPLIDPFGHPIRRAQAFDQIVIEDGADTPKMCRAMQMRGLDKDRTIIYPDPAGRARSTRGPPDNEILKTHGWNRIQVRLVAPQFRKRQLATNNLLSKGLIKLHPKKCKALKKDCEAVEQDKATYEKIKDNPKLTHASDGMDYFVDIAFPLSGRKPDTGSIRVR